MPDRLAMEVPRKDSVRLSGRTQEHGVDYRNGECRKNESALVETHAGPPHRDGIVETGAMVLRWPSPGKPGLRWPSTPMIGPKCRPIGRGLNS